MQETPEKSYTKLSTRDKEVAARLNAEQDYKRTNMFLKGHAPNAAAQHVALVKKNRKDNQQRK